MKINYDSLSGDRQTAPLFVANLSALCSRTNQGQREDIGRQSSSAKFTVES